MKTKILALFLVAGGLMGLSSCHKVLDLSPNDKIRDFELWNNQQLVVYHTNSFYSLLRSGFNSSLTNNGQWLLSNLTDDAVPPANSNVRTTWETNFTSASTSPLNTILWITGSSSRWVHIRKANTFMANIDNVPGDQALNKRLKAEIRFLRAYYYFELVSYFGAVPIITVAQETTDSDLFPAKNTLAECYDFISNELDLAAAELPTTYPASDVGRITKQAAWGLKCRVQMMREDWAGAAKTAKDIMGLGVNSLYQKAGASAKDKYAAVFSDKNNVEILLSVQHNNLADELGTKFDAQTMPPYYGGSGNNCPTQNLVDEYEMLPGKTFDITKPYANRDPRFDATILFDGASYKGRTMDMGPGGADVTLGGLVTTNNVTQTGYYLRKFTNESINPADANVRSSNNWPLIRYAEILLNFAEAQNEANGGPDADVYKAVNDVRARVGMPNLATGLSQIAMRDAIRHERRIELAFEDHRYWDVKRWKLATGLFNFSPTSSVSPTSNKIRKATITVTGGVKTYKFTDPVANWSRTFVTKHYLFPIPQSEWIKPGNKLDQNPGWEQPK